MRRPGDLQRPVPCQQREKNGMELRLTGGIDRMRIRIDDEERLVALRSYKILDTGLEPNYERLVDLVHQACQSAWAAVAFVDRERQWFKAQRGFHLKETPRSISFCSVGMQQVPPLIVENALLDARFRDNRLVTEYGIRFFAGYPLFSSDGYGLGSVCVLDTRPRTLMNGQLAVIEKARNWVQADLERRRAALRWKSDAEAATTEDRRAGEQKQAMKKMVAETAWQALVTAAEAAGPGR